MKNIIWYILVAYCTQNSISGRYEIEQSPVYPDRFGVYDTKEKVYILFAEDPNKQWDTTGPIIFGHTVISMGSINGMKPIDILIYYNNTLSLDSAIMVLKRIENINP